MKIFVNYPETPKPRKYPETLIPRNPDTLIP